MIYGEEISRDIDVVVDYSFGCMSLDRHGVIVPFFDQMDTIFIFYAKYYLWLLYWIADRVGHRAMVTF